MPEIRTVTTLCWDRDEISASIRLYEKKAAPMRRTSRRPPHSAGTDRPQHSPRYALT
jgi:hypothetical protein